MKNALMIDGNGQGALLLLGHKGFQELIDYSHMVTDNDNVIPAANNLGLNDYSTGTIDNVVERLTVQYRALNMYFDLVFLTETDVRQPDDDALENWNELLEAAGPMLDLAGTEVCLITQRKIDPREVETMAKVHIFATNQEALDHILGAVPA